MVERSRLSDTPLVLLVDDQPSNLAMLRQMVRWAGYRTCEAQSGEQALRLLEEQQPDVVVLDIYMPEMDGFAVLRAIRSHSSISYTPVIMITAESESRARQQAYNEGADDFLLKPIESETLRARLRVAIHLKRTLTRVEMERERFAFVATLSRDLSRIGSLPEMLDHIVTTVRKALRADHANLIILRSEGAHEVLGFISANLKTKLSMVDIERVVREGAASYAIRYGESVRIEDISNDYRWLKIEGSVVENGSALIVPLLDGDQTLGVLAVYHDTTAYYTDDDQVLLELVASQIAGILRQTQLRDEQMALTEQLSMQARQLELVNGLAQTLAANVDLPMLYEVITQQMRVLLGDVATGWYAFTSDGAELAAASLSELDTNPELDAQSVDILRQISALERTTAFDLTDTPNLPSITKIREYGYQGCVAVPLHHQGHVLGVLMVAMFGRLFSAEEITLLEMARPHLAIAMATAQTLAGRAARQQEQAELLHLRNMAELAGHMAHHFNNLFAAILGNTQLAELDAVNEEQQFLLATVVDQVRDGTAMIRRLHLLKGGERNPPPDPLDLSEAISNTLDHLAQSIKIPPITVEQIDPNLHVLLMERELTTLCGELISNALESGSPPEQVTISAIRSGKHALIQIRDAGQGVAPANLAHNIWRPFWTTHGPQRMGLGLPICSALTWRIGGSITLTPNTPEPGMTATLRLPLAEQEIAHDH